MRLTLRNVCPWGAPPVDVAMDEGRIVAIGARLEQGGEEIDGGGGVLLPGLHDHHLHILATAARRTSIELVDLCTPAAVGDALQRAAAAVGPGSWLRVVDYDERAAGLPDRALLDGWVHDRPVRLQDRTGALWVLNGAALRLLEGQELPPGAERDEHGRPSGRFWREDAWLGRVLPRSAPDIAQFGAELAVLGLVGLTDAGAQNGVDAARTLGAGQLPQRLVLMGDETLSEGEGYSCGPLKLLIDERAPPGIEDLAARITIAREQGRAVAAHCVTAAELTLFIGALDDAAGAHPGDRIEHGGVIPDGFVPEIAARGLTVVTNPAFVHDRGDRYRSSVPQAEWSELYRTASLIAAGIPMAAGSDAPYAQVDPWLAMRTARKRLTSSGEPLAVGEAIGAKAALGLYLAEGLAPGGPARAIAVGEPADLIVCAGSLEDVLDDLSADRVAATIIAGRTAFARG